MILTLYGKPQPKERPKVYNGHGITPTKTRQYEARLAAEWSRKYPTPLTEPVSVNLVFFLPTPTSWSKKKKELAERGIIRPTSRPDVDNLVKIVLDAIQGGVAFLDDKQVVELYASKWYSENPRTEIKVNEL